MPQKKKQYAPGESGTIKVTYSASKHPRKATQSLTVLSNDPTHPKVKLTIKATVVFIIQPDPEYFQLSLKAENASCPQITLTSTDNQPFAITSFESPGQLITAQFEPTRKATTLVIEPKVDTARLKDDSRGTIKIGVTHPKSNTVTIRFSVLPRFKISPQLLLIRNAEPQKAVTKQLSITSNYDEHFEIESTSSKNNLVSLSNQEKVNNHYKLELEITPPPIPEGKERFFTDVFHVNIKGGKKLSISCRGSYPKKK